VHGGKLPIWKITRGSSSYLKIFINQIVHLKSVNWTETCSVFKYLL
jgi:hypothetical protein